MPSTTSILLVTLLASSVLAAPASHDARSVSDDASLESSLASRDSPDSTGELDERFFFLPFLAQGIRAGVQAGVKAGIKKGAKAGAKKGAKSGAKHGTQQHNNNQNSKGKKHKRDLDEDDVDVYIRELTELEGDLDERFFFLPLLAQGIRAGVQAGVKAGIKKGAKAGAKKGAKSGAKHGAQQHNNNNNNNNKGNRRHKRDLGELEGDEQMLGRTVFEDDSDWDITAREIESLERLD